MNMHLHVVELYIHSESILQSTSTNNYLKIKYLIHKTYFYIQFGKIYNTFFCFFLIL